MRLVDADELRNDLLCALCGTGYQSEALYCVDRAETIDQESVRMYGRWVDEYKSGYKPLHGTVCDKCDCWNNRRSAYCPNCGIKMDRGVEK